MNFFKGKIQWEKKKKRGEKLIFTTVWWEMSLASSNANPPHAVRSLLLLMASNCPFLFHSPSKNAATFLARDFCNRGAPGKRVCSLRISPLHMRHLCQCSSDAAWSSCSHKLTLAWDQISAGLLCLQCLWCDVCTPPPLSHHLAIKWYRRVSRKNCASLCFFGLMFVRKEYQNMEKNPGKWNERTLQRENNKLKALKLSCFNQFNASL